MNGHIAYLCLQATREGQASHAHVHEIIKGLVRRDWQVELFEPRYKEKSRLPGAFGRMMEFVRMQRKMWKRIRKKADVLYIRFHFATLPSLMWARRKKMPVVLEVNGPYEDLFLAWPWTRRMAPLFLWMMRKLLRDADAVITVTPQLKAWVLQEAPGQTVEVVPNGANTELFEPMAVSQRALPERYAVFFGALTVWQGIETILQAAARPEWPQDLSLVIVGDGVERPRVEEAAARDSRIVYLGSLQYREVPGVVARSLIGLSPQSDRGGRARTGLFPLKVFETLACGVPVVVTDFPGQADLVRDTQCGAVVPPDDPKALAETIAALYADPLERERMQRRGREAVVGGHSWDCRAEDTAKVVRLVR